MRSPVIAFSILAAAAVGPSLVAGAPTSPNPDSAHSPRQLSNPMNRLDTPGLPVQPPVSPPAGLPLSKASKDVQPPSILSGIGILGGGDNSDSKGSDKPDPSTHRQAEQQLHNPSSSLDAYTTHSRRASDMNTAGGNSYTGASSDTSGGSVVSVAHGGDFGGDDDDDIDEDGLTNAGGNTGGAAGEGFSGFSYGGDGDGKGAGGNAYSGAVGPSEGGDVVSASDHGIDNTAANAGGAGGFDESGDANGGDAAGNIVDGVDTSDYTVRRKRGQDSGTAGGNAYSGASSNVDGGNVINHSEDEGETFNDAAQTGGDAGETYSGDANGGEGDGFGPGGNAYSGATGSAVGGSVINSGGFVENEDTVTGGDGGESESGDAEGGDA
ncbi:uncharacterized protein C8Q71DRAFT_724389 [Rhodofomes roseus]|uniref:Uncharacterized protein n=1 Tax=Rhodofomes roseus TaxID=34475 RepID=A0ABQ8KDT1_9APHY|nr:uncharacterized protein C8Q71DRAFT_724389 [Rhodofomes roseus]KAH9835804.1 hypothetical protein C8Q71DRAFT_724389 [Rhodofomes roseus]